MGREANAEIRNEIGRQLDSALEIAENYFATKQTEIIPYASEKLDAEFIEALAQMHSNCSKATTGFTNIITGLSIKAAMGNCVDIRYHQTQIQDQTNRPAGFNFRGISENIIYFWLSTHEFVCAKSGWQTRTFERPKPYMLDYDENIDDIKEAFLQCYDQVENNSQDPLAALAFLFWRQLQLREASRIDIAIPNISDVLQIAHYFELHFGYRYKESKGASRLPVLALYAIYQVIIDEVARYNGKVLRPLEAHSAADARTGALGDIEVLNKDDSVFESLEIKHEIPITRETIETVKKKIRGSRVDRYYILTTHNLHDPSPDIANEIEIVKRSLGTQLIANGVVPTIKYYLRLLSNPSTVFAKYADLLSSDSTIAFEHKDIWNQIAIGEIQE
jgi:DNA (cytosine-5)-methyltransferase 1